MDIGFEIDFYGVIYFCTHCIAEIAHALGYITYDENKKLKEQIDGYIDHVSELSAENVKFRVALSQLDFLGSHGAVVDNDTSAEKPVEQKRLDNSKSVKQVDEPGPTNIPKTGKSNRITESADLEDLL